MTAQVAARTTPQGEFIALIAMMMATVAFSIDAMLPALPSIAAELSPDAPNNAQLIVTMFMLGMGIGTFVMGPLSDAFGRKSVMVGAAAVYCAGAALAYFAPTLETILFARLIQGFGGAGARIVAVAMVRDLYKGREMARVISFVMMVFMIVPAAAPMLGNFIILGFGWRAVFVAFLVFSLLSTIWLYIRQAETLPFDARRRLNGRAMVSGVREVFSNKLVVMSTIAQGLIFASMFATISSIQQIFEVTLGRGESFPYWFALAALLSGVSSFTNSRLVVRLGMRYLITTVLGIELVITVIVAILNAGGMIPDTLMFPLTFFWFVTMFFMLGMTMGNLNALALEPLGHLAGLAASATGSVATIIAVSLAAPLGLAFDGTLVPLSTGISIYLAGALVMMKLMPKRD